MPVDILEEMIGGGGWRLNLDIDCRFCCSCFCFLVRMYQSCIDGQFNRLSCPIQSSVMSNSIVCHMPSTKGLNLTDHALYGA